MRNSNHEVELNTIQTTFNELKEKKANTEEKYLQMKAARERMNDIRSVFNRFFSN